MKNTLVALLLLVGLTLSAQTNYKFSEIPDSLKKRADYVVWEDRMVFDIINNGKANEKVRFAVTITNEKANNYNRIYVPYDKNEEVRSFKAWIYDSNGELVKKAKKSDFKDMSAVSSFSLYEDDRVIMAEMLYNDYPYTLVYEYEKKVDGLMYLPTWTFQSEKTGVILSELKVLTPVGLKLNFKEFNLNNAREVSVVEGKTLYTWKEKNLKPFESIALAPTARSYFPMLYISNEAFIEGGFAGKMDSWNNFGKWNWVLNKGRDILPEETKAEIKRITKNTIDDKEKIKLLYEYMQEKTRYVSVQLGIGGFQTFSAEYVDTKGYGDCKALSNYMYSMLKELGIKSHYSLIYAGRNGANVMTDFPSSQFNHAILCVPLPKDTVWLECTSQKKPFNFLGSFTNDRHALIVTENGGKLVKTPKYGKEVSTQNRAINVSLNNEGNAKATVKTEFKGLQYENREGWSAKTVEKQKDYIKEVYGISGMEINSFKFSEFKEEIPYIIEDLDIDIKRMASTSGKRMFIKLNLFNNSSYVPKNEERTIPFHLTYEFADNDTLSIELPEGYEIESKPKNRDYQTKFGSYITSFKQEGNKILFVRSYSSEKGIFPAEDYKAYYDFRKKIKKADRAKLVLVKKV